MFKRSRLNGNITLEIRSHKKNGTIASLSDFRGDRVQVTDHISLLMPFKTPSFCVLFWRDHFLTERLRKL